MSRIKEISIFIGSLRKEAYTRKIANTLINLGEKNLNLKIVEIGHLSFYNQDLDGNEPSSWLEFRETVKNSDGFLFITPEYNRSVTPVLKNALDIASRPYGANCWSGKPGGIIGASIGAIGGFGAVQHLRQTFAFLNILMLQQPEAYLGFIDKAFEGNTLTNEKTKEFLQNYLNSYAEWVNKF
ncbi:NADPH-dependent FMN reductase [Desulfovibrio litoralis]|uniref:NAD(P)H-dependent FMN reductase n=1 Tax=Desulfovibrio litoralis DSM 11393 TaxID=1121455 RepID=A0A1M7SAM5_9BACT|nr:NAD(P)H-dependent oxidoreductase [Desulfovibrio litoralis]SHN55526.1 NAD(P)H-dependent FMN reductase [Desulfovibrio litoralis DSM 11393]